MTLVLRMRTSSSAGVGTPGCNPPRGAHASERESKAVSELSESEVSRVNLYLAYGVAGLRTLATAKAPSVSCWPNGTSRPTSRSTRIRKTAWWPKATVAIMVAA